MKTVTLINNEQTMTSNSILELLNTNREKPMELKELHRYIKEEFNDEIEGGKIPPTLRANGQVDFYNIPEVESKMIVASKDKKYLRQITEYWVNQEKENVDELDIAILSLQRIKEQKLRLDSHETRLNTVENKVDTYQRKGYRKGTYKCEQNYMTIGDMERSLIKSKKPVANSALRRLFEFYASEIKKDGEHCLHKEDCSNVLIRVFDTVVINGAFVQDTISGHKFKADWLIKQIEDVK